jgi:hypothetical protein
MRPGGISAEVRKMQRVQLAVCIGADQNWVSRTLRLIMEWLRLLRFAGVGVTSPGIWGCYMEIGAGAMGRFSFLFPQAAGREA